MTTYINGKYQSEDIETLDEFETLKEAKKMIREYQLAYQGSGYTLWLSQRSTNDWRQND